MRGERRSLPYGKGELTFTLLRRRRRTLEIAVEPDTSVVVVAPLEATIEAITQKLRKRAPWIKRQQRFFSQYLPRTPARRYLAGETHLYLGRQYRLKVIQDIQTGVRCVRGFIEVRTHVPRQRQVTEKLLTAWYQRRARETFSRRLEAVLARFADPDRFRPVGLIVRQLRLRWGSMSPMGRLLLNRRLIEAPTQAIDYVIAHELCHLAEPHHGPQFFALLERVMPDWRRRKELLERAMA